MAEPYFGARVKIKGQKEAVAHYDKMIESIPLAGKEAAREFANFIQRFMRKFAYEDKSPWKRTGDLRRGIRVRILKDGPLGISLAIYSSAVSRRTGTTPYAVMQEIGTAGMTIRSKSGKKMPLELAGGSVIFTKEVKGHAPKRYTQRAIDLATDRFDQVLDINMSDAMQAKVIKKAMRFQPPS